MEEESCCWFCLETVSDSDAYVTCGKEHKFHIRCFCSAYDKMKGTGGRLACLCGHVYVESNMMMAQLNSLIEIDERRIIHQNIQLYNDRIVMRRVLYVMAALILCMGFVLIKIY